MTTTSETTEKSVVLRLFLVSLLSLFVEMLVIRWLSTEIRVFAYFKNLPLMAAFWGLGLGFLWTSKKFDFMKLSSTLLLYFSGLMIFAIALNLTHISFFENTGVMLFGDFQKGGGNLKLIGNLAILLGIFALTASIFVGLGQETGKLFDKLRPLQAYGVNVGGALAGIILFTVVSYLEQGPGTWLIITGLLYFLVTRRITSMFLVVLGITYMVYLAPFMAKELFHEDYITTKWSPYYRIDVKRARLNVDGKEIPAGYDIYINYDSFQSMLDCTPEMLGKVKDFQRKAMRHFYERPLKVSAKENKDVLILGAGSGSDVAAALRCNANHIDAVEIDKTIYELGKQIHPEHPYDSDKVTVHIMDARTYLQNCTKKYDVIIYAQLDSHTAFSSLSSLRTDNYIFTAESYREAAKLLKPDGYITVCFISLPDWLFERQASSLTAGTGREPAGYFWVSSLATGFLVNGPSLPDQSKLNVNDPPRKIENKNQVGPITDDWPFLFLPKREIPNIYFLPLIIVVLLCIFPVNRLLAGGKDKLVNWQMFFLGMGFMLLEVRALSATSLLCGATWIVNSFVIGGVMVAILVGNYIASRLSSKAIYALVLMAMLTIVISNFVGISSLQSFGMVPGITIGTAVYLSPLLFAGSVFSLLFKQASEPSRALAFNMIGGLIGIVIEYISMITGIKALAWIGIGIYCVVLALEKMRHSPDKVEAASG